MDKDRDKDKNTYKDVYREDIVAEIKALGINLKKNIFLR
jgi:ribosomal protein L9